MVIPDFAEPVIGPATGPDPWLIRATFQLDPAGVGTNFSATPFMQ